MPHYKTMYDDKEHLYAHDLAGREVTVQIEKVFAGELMGDKGRKSKKPMIKFVGKEKKLAVNKTNGKVIATMYGKDTDDWVDRWITIYPTTTEFGGETVDCIRVKPQVPRERADKRGKGAKGFDVTQNEIEQRMKDKGMLDETSKERVEKIERDDASDFARQKARVEQIIGRSLDDNPDLTEAEQRAVKAAVADGGDVPS